MGKLLWPWSRQKCLKYDIKSTIQKKKNVDELNCIETKNACCLKVYAKGMKRPATDWKKYL